MDSITIEVLDTSTSTLEWIENPEWGLLQLRLSPFSKSSHVMSVVYQFQLVLGRFNRNTD